MRAWTQDIERRLDQLRDRVKRRLPSAAASRFFFTGRPQA
jgi:hypothetical protein